MKEIISFCVVLLFAFGLIFVCKSLPEEKNAEKTAFIFEEQPEQADGLLFDPVTGHVYKCFEREDGNYQLWLYPDGNLQVVYYIEKDGAE